MPVNKNALIRYRTIDKCLRNKGKVYSLYDLAEECDKALYNAGNLYSDKLSIRTIQKDLQFIQEEYNAEIESQYINRRKYFAYADKSFSIDNSPLSDNDKKTLNQILSTLSLFSGQKQFEWIDEINNQFKSKLNFSESTEKIIEFEENIDLKGREHLGELFDVILNKTVVSIDYKPFDKEKINYIVSPYFLKQYNSRWFLLCKDKNNNNLLNLPLDRIINICLKPEEIFIPSNINFADYFEDMIGVTKFDDAEPKKIIFWIKKERSYYIQTKPIHLTQTLIKDNDIKLRLQKENPNLINGDFYYINVLINYELINTILSFGKDIVIIEPLDVRQKIINVILEMKKQYLL